MIRKELVNPYLSLIARLILGTVFIYAAVSKIADPFGFSIDIRNYHILPDMLTNSAAVFLPWIEFYCGLFLIAGLYTRTSSTILSGLIILFIFAIASALIRGFDIACGCFSAADSSNINIGKIVEDVILLLLALQITAVKQHRLALDNLLRAG